MRRCSKKPANAYNVWKAISSIKNKKEKPLLNQRGFFIPFFPIGHIKTLFQW